MTPNSPRPNSFPSSYLRRIPSPIGSGRTRLGGWKINLRERLVEESKRGLEHVLLLLLLLLLTGLFPKGEPFNGDETQLPMGVRNIQTQSIDRLNTNQSSDFKQENSFKCTPWEGREKLLCSSSWFCFWFLFFFLVLLSSSGFLCFDFYVYLLLV